MIPAYALTRKDLLQALTRYFTPKGFDDIQDLPDESLVGILDAIESAFRGVRTQ